jgi:23S rRNA pseudouridine955/2504/2580 synthase
MKNIDILYEDPYCLVLNKPAGLAVQGGAGVGANLDALLASEYSPRPLLVHRLDKETSGVILTAKNPEAAAWFSKIIAGRGALKQYIALCANRTGGGAEAALKKTGVIKTELIIKGEKKYAETKYKILDEFIVGPQTGCLPAALFELELGTGRTHQIRRTLALKKYPVLGDDKYGDFALNKKLKKERGLKNLLLHSSRLNIELPCGKILDVSAPPPEYFKKLQLQTG